MPDAVFAFFERPENLARITPPWLDFRILWDHRHRFRSENGGTTVEDEVLYQLSCGPFARLAHGLFVRRRLDAIFDYRRERIEALLLGKPSAVATA